MANGESSGRGAGSLLPAGLYATLRVHGRSAEDADALVALALEEHLVWGGIRLRREQAAREFRMSDDFGRTFVTNDRLDADLAPRNALVSRIGALLGIPAQMAEVATTLLEAHIDAQVLSGQQFTAPGLFITGRPPGESVQWLFQQWWSSLSAALFAQAEVVQSGRRHGSEWLGWSGAIATRPPLSYVINLLVAADVRSSAPESVPWTDASLGVPPSTGTVPEAMG
jgi:hypothetical protein